MPNIVLNYRIAYKQFKWWSWCRGWGKKALLMENGLLFLIGLQRMMPWLVLEGIMKGFSNSDIWGGLWSVNRCLTNIHNMCACLHMHRDYLSSLHVVRWCDIVKEYWVENQEKRPVLICTLQLRGESFNISVRQTVLRKNFEKKNLDNSKGIIGTQQSAFLPSVLSHKILCLCLFKIHFSSFASLNSTFN